MSHKIEVNEPRRTVHFTSGERLDLTNVEWFDNSGSYLRIKAREGLAIINPDNVNFHLIKPEGKTDEVQERYE